MHKRYCHVQSLQELYCEACGVKALPLSASALHIVIVPLARDSFSPNQQPYWPVSHLLFDSWLVELSTVLVHPEARNCTPLELYFDFLRLPCWLFLALDSRHSFLLHLYTCTYTCLLTVCLKQCTSCIILFARLVRVTNQSLKHSLDVELRLTTFFVFMK